MISATRSYLRVRRAQAERDLLKAATVDPFWNPDDLRERVARTFRDINTAWSESDETALDRLLVPSLRDAWIAQLHAMKAQALANRLSGIDLERLVIERLEDLPGTEQDAFWVKISYEAADVTVRATGEATTYNLAISENWKFRRRGDALVLEEKHGDDPVSKLLLR
jgi:predicted lipid-binding transport protein (Tim44 family)